MIRKRLPYDLFLGGAALLAISAGFALIAAGHHHNDVPRGNEKELKVNLEAGFGNVIIGPGADRSLFSMDVDADLPTDLSDFVNYSVTNQIGYLNINTSDALEEHSHNKNKKHGVHISGFDDSRWAMRFTREVPISFDIELGMGKGTMDFTGLAVKDLNISTGASSVEIRFDEPNRSSIENLNIETGLSKLKAYGLCNANFNHMKFEGGVGSYLLDFGGTLDREVNGDIEVGMGSVTVVIPRDIGAKIYYEKRIISSIDLPGDFYEQEENNYYSKNYRSADGRINLHIEAGLGSVKIER
jgi:hypothetical protein